MKVHDWFLLIFSAFLYAAAFLWSNYCWFLVFIFPILFLHVAAHNRLTFWHGFVWSFITLFLHMIGGICVVVHMAHNSWAAGCALALSVIIVQALCGGMLFFDNIRTGIVTLLLFIFWVDRWCLWMFDVIEGYPLMHPLIVLIHKTQLLWLLPIIGKNVLTLLFLVSAASVVVFMQYKNAHSLLLCVISFLPWVAGLWFENEHEKPVWLQLIKPVPYMMINYNEYSEVGMRVALQDIFTFLDQADDCSIGIVPESSLQMCDETIFMKHNKHLLCGVSRICDNKCYNSLVWLHQGNIMHCYDKQHAMLLSERLPSCLNNTFLRTIYFGKNCYLIAKSSKKREKITLGGGLEFVPYICSELFFSEYPDDDYANIPILVIVNDSVFLQHRCSQYVCKLLQLLAQFKAMQWQREIVYVSYANSFYVNQNGGVFYLFNSFT